MKPCAPSWISSPRIADRPTILYFAYGSNLYLPRLQCRVPVAELLGPATLTGWRLRWNKRGSDGTAKCNIVPADSLDGVVLGAVFRVCAEGRHALDRIESGYHRIDVDPGLPGGRVRAFTYVSRSDMLDDTLRPAAWYRGLVLRGAESLDFPESYLEGLRTVPVLESLGPG
jgi:hypothetical protein